MKLLTTNTEKDCRFFIFEHKEKTENVWFSSEQSIDKKTENVTPFLFFGTIFAMLDDGVLDLNNHIVSKKAVENIQIIASRYLEWFPELNLKPLTLKNYQLGSGGSEGENGKTLAFTGGVDSLYSLQKMIRDGIRPCLFYIEGFDNHYKDQNTHKKIHSQIKQLIKAYNLDQITCIRTNLRDFTEQYIDWEKIHGLCLASSVYVLEKKPKEMYISLGWTQADDYNCGSQIDLNPLFSTETTVFKDTGLETRMEKIKTLSNHPLLLPHLRVCWKNPSHRLNCGACEKCIRTMLALMAFLSEDHVYKLFEIQSIHTKDLERISISNEEVFWFYKDILNNLPDSMYKIKKNIQQKNEKYSTLSPSEKNKNIWPPSKQKAVLFIDFNGVISYKPFWFSLSEQTHKLHHLHEPIERFLFKENIHIIREWMRGVHTSEEVHELIYAGLDRNFHKDDLWEVFVDDCRNIDVSSPIITELNKMKDSYHIVLMTDNMDSLERFTIDSQKNLFTVFDVISNSYNEKRGKRDEGCASFYKYIDTYNANRTHCILLDDSSGNCQGFEEHVGGRSFQVKTEDEVLDTLQTIQDEQKHRWEWQY